MKKYFFLEKDILTKHCFLIFGVFLFSFKLAFLYFLVLIPYIFLFRKKSIEISDKLVFDSNVMLSPVSGTFHGERVQNGKRTILITISPVETYGIYMPFKGEAKHYFEKCRDYKMFGFLTCSSFKVQIALKSEQFETVKIKSKSLTSLRKLEIWLRSGDLVAAGANIGYLPFGGKVVIELPLECELLVKKGDKVQSGQTLLASIKGTDNE